MKPLYLEMNAFGPYARRQVIDFRRLEDHKLFLIYGPTGAGKTTVLDAMCYALYGETSGNRRSGAHMRSEYASPEEETYVVFAFAIGPARYCVERRPEQQIAKKRGTGLKKSAASAALYAVDEKGEKTAVIATKKVGEEVERLLGFKAEQFRQVVLLPQGDFRRLLLASSADRQQIMQTLFHTQRYARLQELAKEKYDDILSQYDLRKERIAQLLQSLGAGDAAALTAMELAADEEQRLRQGELDAAIADRDAYQKTVQDAQVLYSHWQNLKESRRLREQLRQQETAMAEKQAYIDVLRRAQLLAEPCRQLDDIQAQGVTAGQKAGEAAVQAERALQRLQAVRKEAEALQAQGAAHDADARQLVLLQNMAEKAEQYGELCRKARQLADQSRHADEVLAALQKEREALQARIDAGRAEVAGQPELAAAWEQAKGQAAAWEERLNREAAIEALAEEVAQRDRACRAAEDACRRAAAGAEQAQLNYEGVQTLFLQGQAALLAKELKAGEPCPVCGATEHPMPAPLAAHMPRKEDVEARKRQARQRDEERRQAELTLQRVQAEFQSLKRQRDDLRAQYPFEYTSVQWRARLDEQKQKVSLLGEQAARAERTRAAVTQWELKQKEEIQKEEQARRQAEAARLAAAQSQSAKEQAEADVPAAYRDAAVLRRHMDDLSQRVKSYDAQAERSRKAVVDAEKEAARWTEQERLLQEQVTALRNQYKAYAADLKERVRLAGLESLQRCRDLQPFVGSIDREQQAVDEYNRDVQQVQGRIAQEEKAVGSQPEPDMAAYKAQLDEKNKLCQQISESCAAAAIRRQELCRGREQIAAWQGEQAELSARYEAVGSIYELISGQHTGVNFERYVLGALLDEVLAAANARLDLMSRRRYELQRSRSWDDKRVRRIGLDIEVFDNYTGYARPANTLSGGETFLASLALALGLADVVQAYSGGIHLDTIFIDEGFGTLDGETLDFALKALMELKQGGRLVGIISHVPELKERIDARLAVHKTDRGSTADFELP